VRSEARAPVANRGMITASIMLATIMQGVDNTIANVALPHIQGSLSAAQDQIAWVLTSYIRRSPFCPRAEMGWKLDHLLGARPAPSSVPSAREMASCLRYSSNLMARRSPN
jgi:hypothetical protein